MVNTKGQDVVKIQKKSWKGGWNSDDCTAENPCL